MRNEYVGDIGDFGKYILLKELSEIGNGGIRVGVNWYYNTRPEGATGYLSSSDSDDYRKLDGDLFDRLKYIVIPCKRTVAEIEKADILPKVHHYYRKAIPYSADTPTDRQKDRENWGNESLKAFDGADVIFLDPDNGIEIPTVQMAQAQAVKYAFIDEVKRYYDKGRSVIIYNHRNHDQLKYFAQTCVELKRKVGLKRDLIVLKAPRFQVRHYVFVSRTDEHAELFRNLHNKLTSQDKYRYLFDCDRELEKLIADLLVEEPQTTVPEGATKYL